METRPEKRDPPSRPRDRSLESYKVWIADIADRLTTDKSKLNMTEAEWIQSWKEYWKQKPRE
jgi:hypothetical protein